MKLVQLNGNRSGSTMDRVPIFNPSDILWRYPIGFQAQHGPYPFLDFKTHLPNSLASDPRLWTREDVMSFLRWCEYEFDLPRFDMDFFQMNGKALCLLTKSDLNERSPGCGDVLHNVLHMLMQGRVPSSPITPHFPLTPTWTMPPAIEFPPAQNSVTLSPAPSLDSQGSPRQPDQNSANVNNSYNSTYHQSGGQSGSSGSTLSDSEEEPNSPTVQNSLSSPQPQSPLNVKPQVFFPSDNVSEPNTNGRLLWDFLQQLLNDSLQRYTSYIAWKNREAGVFKIVDPPGLAKLWGIQKNHLSMNYDKMSRALRYYYRVNILRKVQGERHCYQWFKYYLIANDNLRNAWKRALHLYTDPDRLVITCSDLTVHVFSSTLSSASRRFLRNPSELKNIKHISLLRHQMGGHQTQQQLQPIQFSQPHPQVQSTQQPTQQQPQQQLQQQPQPQQQQPLQPPQVSCLKTECEEEPTDLSTHAHCNGNLAELQLRLQGDEYQQTVQAEDLSLPHTQSIKTEVS